MSKRIESININESVLSMSLLISVKIAKCLNLNKDNLIKLLNTAWNIKNKDK